MSQQQQQPRTSYDIPARSSFSEWMLSENIQILS